MFFYQTEHGVKVTNTVRPSVFIHQFPTRMCFVTSSFILYTNVYQSRRKDRYFLF